MGIHEWMEGIRRKESRRILGLISGTSADGVSAVATEVTGSGLDTGIEILGFRTYPYPSELREVVFELFSPETSTVDKICEMNFVLGEFFAESATKLVEESGFALGEIDLIGSHGQTIHHLPRLREAFGYRSRSTLQIGEPAIIAHRTGVPTVADFRKADVAAGGEGAPLTPYLDFILHRHPNRSRVLQNIGGIANLTYLPAGATIDDVVAFDTGPGNMIIDALVKRYTDGEKSFDKDGKIASKGKVDEGLLDQLLAHPYYERCPPKTTGREEFGEQYASEVARMGEGRKLGFEDIVATATALTAESILRAYERLLPAGSAIDEVYLSGGGAENDFIVGYLFSRLDPIPVAENDLLGVPAAQKEAVLMAVLANEFAMGNPANIPRATGAERAVVLGALYPTL
jgi:anhydro-N-acetylmuramic acid kinase